MKAATAFALFSAVECLAHSWCWVNVLRMDERTNFYFYIVDDKPGPPLPRYIILDSVFKILLAPISFFVKTDQVKPYELATTFSCGLI